MKLNEYKRLSEEEQYRILWDEGVLIDACIEGEVKKLLYAIDNFYVELWSHAISNKVLWKLSFKQGKLLEKYLSKYPVEIDDDLKSL
ncbi:hypothetical protein HYN59_09455 [Flavobacterium album]|uniref:Uncharacterized protein n=1 Tax=Flavobacterium album TaxID=2175091 RepID=A0A2S1QYB9_9FLAO|nr:hypothetical protein [Flavobacterium album]AWH85329.1 hypothetical protein HYN59_09455 [Flavobacterium album]